MTKETNTMKRAAIALLLMLPLGTSCMTTNLVDWADTRVESPIEEHLRIQVMILTLIPAIAGDVVLAPIQLAIGHYPYSDRSTPDSVINQRRGTGTGPRQQGPQTGEYIQTGPRGRVEPGYER